MQIGAAVLAVCCVPSSAALPGAAGCSRPHRPALPPPCPCSATSAGIGLFLAFIGMQASEGLGVSTYNSATLVTLGGCAPEYRTNQYTISGSAIASVGSPDSICYIDSTTGNVTANGGLFVPSGQCRGGLAWGEV